MRVLTQSPAKQPNKPVAVTHSTSNDLPPLQNGDRLSRTEFERRYIDHPEIKKAELIEGVVYVASPVYAQHGLPHSAIIGWLAVYGAATPNIYIADNTSLRLDLDNEVQPDVCVWIDEHWGGQTHIAPDGFIEGTPELVVEVAASSAAHDLNDKLRIYRRNGVREYLVLLAYERELRWFHRQDDEYHLLAPDEQGVLHSQIFPGLNLQPELFWAGDMAGVLAVLQAGLDTTEHKEFVAHLKG